MSDQQCNECGQLLRSEAMWLHLTAELAALKLAARAMLNTLDGGDEPLDFRPNDLPLSIKIAWGKLHAALEAHDDQT